MNEIGASRAVQQCTELILNAASKHIPQRMLQSKKSSHPWLTEDIVQLVANKRATEGTPTYEDKVNKCSAAIMESYKNYAASAKGKLLNARSGSKVWWNLSLELLSQRKTVQSILALKSESGI